MGCWRTAHDVSSEGPRAPRTLKAGGSTPGRDWSGEADKKKRGKDGRNTSFCWFSSFVFSCDSSNCFGSSSMWKHWCGGVLWWADIAQPDLLQPMQVQSVHNMGVLDGAQTSVGLVTHLWMGRSHRDLQQPRAQSPVGPTPKKSGESTGYQGGDDFDVHLTALCWGYHYSQTLAHWLENWEASKDKIVKACPWDHFAVKDTTGPIAKRVLTILAGMFVKGLMNSGSHMFPHSLGSSCFISHITPNFHWLPSAPSPSHQLKSELPRD